MRILVTMLVSIFALTLVNTIMCLWALFETRTNKSKGIKIGKISRALLKPRRNSK